MLFHDTLCATDFLDFKGKKFLCRRIVEIKVRKLSYLN